jgi:hypothetical protein
MKNSNDTIGNRTRDLRNMEKETKNNAHRAFHTSVVQHTLDKTKFFQDVIGRSLTIKR